MFEFDFRFWIYFISNYISLQFHLVLFFFFVILRKSTNKRKKRCKWVAGIRWNGRQDSIHRTIKAQQIKIQQIFQFRNFFDMRWCKWWGGWWCLLLLDVELVTVDVRGRRELLTWTYKVLWAEVYAEVCKK